MRKIRGIRIFGTLCSIEKLARITWLRGLISAKPGKNVNIPICVHLYN
jgi:hypothetical protein